MGHLDSSSERRAYAAHFYRLFGAWRVEWTKSKKAFQIWVWDSLPSPRDAPTAATPMIGNLRAACVVRNGSPGRKILRRFCL